jgi:hypothetical protein
LRAETQRRPRLATEPAAIRPAAQPRSSAAQKHET